MPFPNVDIDFQSQGWESLEPTAMETVTRFSYRLFPISASEKCLRILPSRRFPSCHSLGSKSPVPAQNRPFHGSFIGSKRHPPSTAASAGWFLGLGEKKPVLPEIVKAGDPVLHEPAREVATDEIGSEKIQKIVEDMVAMMRKAPGVGLAAPQIGIPLRNAQKEGIIVLEDTKEYISYARKDEIEAQDRRPFDLLVFLFRAISYSFFLRQVILNPKLKKKGNKTALFFEGCLSIMDNSEAQQQSVDGFRAVVERHLEVEVTGLSRYGQPIKVDAAGWQARILQHECDHLDGTLYVDKMVPRTFRTVDNLDLPLAAGCPELGVPRL
ncbi:Peptide deformylase 1A, chloroplastic/mitochondrial [Asimina triloba]